MGKMEDILAESAETMKMMMAITIVLAITCLVFVICFSPSPHYVMFEEKNEVDEVEEEEGLSVGNTQPSQSAPVLDKGAENIVEEAPKVKKRVTFTDDEVDEMEASAEEDISLRVYSPKRRVVRRKEAARQATWCGGSFRKLAEDAAALVAKEF